jgi:hypothetical protein
MLLKIALTLLVAWLIGVLGLYSAGQFVHVLLLVGLALLMIAFLRVREDAVRRAISDRHKLP